MSKPTRLERIAALYGCFVECRQKWPDMDTLYATFGKPPNTLKEVRIGLAIHAHSISDSEMHMTCQELTNKPLMAFWTGASSEVKP